MHQETRRGQENPSAATRPPWQDREARGGTGRAQEVILGPEPASPGRTRCSVMEGAGWELTRAPSTWETWSSCLSLRAPEATSTRPS